MQALTARPLPITAAMLDDTRAANAYDAMQHTPRSFETELSYLHFRHETMRQWRELPPLMIEFHDGERDYPDSAAMFADMEDNAHLWTRLSAGDDLPADHPMNALMGVAAWEWHHFDGMTNWTAVTLTLNDIFRAVHDINGHYKARRAGLTASFGPIGERNAWLTHRRQYSDAALPALWCETRGQSAWVNDFADHRSLPLPARPYAAQKSGTPPRNLV